METAKKLEMLAELDKLFEEAIKEDETVKVQDVINNNLDGISQKYGVEPVDVFIAYMDHVAINSKKFGNSNGEEKQIEIDFNNLDNIRL